MQTKYSQLKRLEQVENMSEDPHFGRLLHNRYQLLDLIGEGAMGKVYRSQDILLDRVVAVKFLSSDLCNPTVRDLFYTEARTSAQLGLKTIHIVKVEDYGVDDEDAPFYIMEYLHGTGLNEIIRTQPLALPRFFHLARQICLGLQTAHQGLLNDQGELCPVIHRDIKPKNIMVGPNQTLGEIAKVLDFGIAEILKADQRQTHAYMGTPAYSSPEQMEGSHLDPRSDIYSLGIVMFEMLTGQLPIQPETYNFQGWYKAHQLQTPQKLAAVSPGLKLPKPLEILVMGCLEKSAANRPQSIAEIRKTIDPLDQRYAASRDVQQLISTTLESQPPFRHQPLPKSIFIPKWRPDIPPSEVVYGQPIPVNGVNLPALWAMLPHALIQTLQIYRPLSHIYQRFLFQPSPHPMLLWLTAIYNHRLAKPRWFPCYLDLKSSSGWQMIRLLVEQKHYQILLFDLEPPHGCSHQIDFGIKFQQQEELRQWAIISQSQRSISSAIETKASLKLQYERLKPQIEEQLRQGRL